MFKLSGCTKLFEFVPGNQKMLKFMIVFLLFQVAKPDGCDKTKCAGPYTLKDPEIITNKVEMEGVFFTCEKLPSVIKTFTGMRRMHYSIVVNPIIGSTYQKNQVYNLPPSNSELDEWFARKQWAGGKECAKDQNECYEVNLPNGWCGKTETNVWYNGKKNWVDYGVYWSIYGHDTCIKSWEGDFKESEIKIYFNQNKEIVTYQSGWESLKLDSNKRTYVRVNEMTNMLFESAKIETLSKKIDCMKLENNEICMLPRDPWFPPELQGSAANVYDGSFFNHGVFCKQITRKNTGNYGHPVHSNSFNNTNPEFKIIIDSISMLQMQQMYNQMEIIHAVNQLTKVNNQLVSSLSKIDDELLGKIYGIRSKTIWFNPDVFYNCPCYQYNFNQLENCGSNHLYSDGRIVEISSQAQRDLCTRIEKNVTNVTLVDQGRYNFEVLSIPPPDPDPSIWAGWTWISSTKDSLNDLANLFERANDTSNSLGWFNSWRLSDLKLAGGFLGVSSITTWVVVVLVVILLKR